MSQLNIGEQGKVGLFFIFFIFDSSFFFHFSFFCYSFFVIRFQYSFFTFSFFDIQNWAKYRILTIKMRQNIVFLHSKSYFDI